MVVQIQTIHCICWQCVKYVPVIKLHPPSKEEEKLKKKKERKNNIHNNNYTAVFDF